MSLVGARPRAWGKKQGDEPVCSGAYAGRVGHALLGHGERRRVDHGKLVVVAVREEETGATVVKALVNGSTPNALTKLEIEGEDVFSPVGSVLRLSRCWQLSWGPRPLSRFPS